jgi:protein-tyrosine phosphatase
LKKILKISLCILLTLLIAVISSPAVNKTTAVELPEENRVNLVLDGLSNYEVLPKHFRKTTDLTIIKNINGLTLTGLNKLNISGSEQFSVKNLPLLLEAIGTSLPLTVVDLRQESHGFINEYAVSWADAKNNANAGLTWNQVLLDETNKLKSIKLNVPITFYNHPKLSVVPQIVQNENQLFCSKALAYLRVTVRDGGIPTDDMVDYFIEAMRTQPENSWLHFHCKEGIGRTGTFMIMYDMMKNNKEVSAETIIRRQLALANYDDSTLQSFYNPERTGLLFKFYDYCRENDSRFNIKWSEWNKAIKKAS